MPAGFVDEGEASWGVGGEHVVVINNCFLLVRRRKKVFLCGSDFCQVDEGCGVNDEGGDQNNREEKKQREEKDSLHCFSLFLFRVTWMQWK